MPMPLHTLMLTPNAHIHVHTHVIRRSDRRGHGSMTLSTEAADEIAAKLAHCHHIEVRTTLTHLLAHSLHTHI